jgi:rhamnose transport system substrate-binding protein
MKKSMVVSCVLLLIPLAMSFAGGGQQGGAASGDKKLEMVFIPKNTGNPYFDAIDTGFLEASKELGFNYTTVGPATAEATSQISIIEAQIQRGVNVIGIYLNSVDALSSVLQRARQRGIVVLNLGTDSSSPNDRDAFLGATDMDLVGPRLIKIESELIGGSGEIAIVSGTTDSPDHNYWIASMRNELATKPEYASIKIVEVAYGNDDPQKSATEAEALINKYPNLKGIIAPTTVACAATAQAIATMGVADRIKMTGLGNPNEMRAYIKNGTVTKFGLWKPADMGYAGAYLANDILKNGYKVAAGDVKTFGNLGQRPIKPGNIIDAGTFLIFDKNNIDDYNW